jgi:small conductance mechanosensitive channel
MLPFHVVVITADNQRVTVPNTLLTNGAFRNHSALACRRAQWTLALNPNDELAGAREALQTRLQADSRILAQPAPQILLQEWTAEKRVLTVQAWTNTAHYPEVQQDMLETLGQVLEAWRRGETIALPGVHGVSEAAAAEGVGIQPG